MLSNEHIALVKATVPLLESGGEALTTHFYRMMLSEYPQVRPLFNQAHQASGDQPRALANGVLMYARHIDRLQALGPLVSQVVQKHVSLQILPEHYPIVGSCLLRAIREVLGAEIATDEVIEAWRLAYGQLADLLIGAEEEIYAATERTDGGWRGGRAFRVASKVNESEEITSFYLQPADGGSILDFIPGQYIGIRLFIDGEEVRRNYSLSAGPNGREYRISVKREPGGRVSNYLHDRVADGDEVELFIPAGEFTLNQSKKPLVLISAGVGITPLMTMLEAAVHSGRPIRFIHCARHAGVQAFTDRVEELVAANPQVQRFYCLEEQRPNDGAHAHGRLSLERLKAWLPAERDVDAYFLGPKPFMSAVRRNLRELGVPDAQARYEFFGPASSLDA